MPSPRQDRVRLTLMLLLLGLAFWARGSLSVDVENLAMKALGTDTEAAAELRRREFGDEPRLLLLATPREARAGTAPERAALDTWAAAVEQGPGVADLLRAPTPEPDALALGLSIEADGAGRYADTVAGLLERARTSLPPTHDLAVAGLPPVELAIAAELHGERERLLPRIALALALALLALYRRPLLVLGVLLSPLVGVFLVEGLQGALGLALDPVSSLLGPAVLTVGVASGVHLVERYRRELAIDPRVAVASAAAVRRMRFPLLLTLATTVAGFLGLAASPIPAVRRFGLFASIGVALAVATTLLALPALLRSFPGPTLPPIHRPGSGSPRAARLTARLASAAPALAALTGLLLVGGLALTRGQEVDSDPMAVLPPEHALVRDAARVTASLGGSEVFDLLLPPERAPGRPSAGPRAALELAALVGSVAELPGVVGPAGPPEVSPAGYRLASFLLTPATTTERGKTFAAVEGLARGAGWPAAQATGLSVRVARDSNALVRGQRLGLGLSALLLFAVMSLGFRSLPLGLLGLLPNVLTVAVLQGALGLAGAPLTLASTMIGTVMLGLVVDDTIHWLDALRAARGSLRERVASALDHTARPIALTTLALGLGFAMAWTGDLGTTRQFGLLAVGTLVIALAADLVLLPALVLLREPRPTTTEAPCELPTTS